MQIASQVPPDKLKYEWNKQFSAERSALGLGRVKTFWPRETGDAKFNLACCHNCELESTWLARSAVSDLIRRSGIGAQRAASHRLAMLRDEDMLVSTAEQIRGVRCVSRLRFFMTVSYSPGGGVIRPW